MQTIIESEANNYGENTYSVCCCFCDLRFPNTQQVTVNPIASPTSATTRRPITPPKATDIESPTCVLHTTPSSKESSSAMSTQWRMLFIILQLLIGAVPWPKVVTAFEPVNYSNILGEIQREDFYCFQQKSNILLAR